MATPLLNHSININYRGAQRILGKPKSYDRFHSKSASITWQKLKLEERKPKKPQYDYLNI